MHRTNIYLTDAQDRALRARAASTGSTKSAVLRDLLDRGLAIDVADPTVDEELARLSDGYLELVGDLFDDDPDLRIDR